MVPLRKLAHDPLFVIALVTGPGFWLIWFLYQNIPLNLGWPRDALLTFLLLSVIYPVLEEIVFRGALQGWLRGWREMANSWRGLTFANGLTSLVFSTLHMFQNSLSVSILVFIPSLIFGFFRDRYDRVLPSIFLHVFYNFGFVWIFFDTASVLTEGVRLVTSLR